MTIANHTLVGSTIALTVHQPWLALPLAFLSHYVLDSLPHFGFNRANYAFVFKYKISFVMLALDVIGVMAVILYFDMSNWIILTCAFMAIAPDLEWPYRFFLVANHGNDKPLSRLSKLHKRIQWCERPWGIYLEVLFFLSVSFAAMNL